MLIPMSKPVPQLVPGETSTVIAQVSPGTQASVRERADGKGFALSLRNLSEATGLTIVLASSNLMALSRGNDSAQIGLQGP
jgi:hypothetical protein